jgi:hypothetical protein
MNSISLFPSQGFLFELNRFPVGLPRHLEREGVADFASRTVDGLYVEPSVSLNALMTEFRRLDIQVYSVRAADPEQTWERTARSAATAPQRLQNPLSPCWLPTRSSLAAAA